jgi:hypothetical protein
MPARGALALLLFSWSCGGRAKEPRADGDLVVDRPRRRHPLGSHRLDAALMSWRWPMNEACAVA